MKRGGGSGRYVGLLAFVAACSASATDDKAPPSADPPPCVGAPFQGRAFGARCGMIVDREGRDVLLYGLNARVGGVFDVELDGGRVPLERIPAFGAEDAQRMRALGFDALRLPIQWSAVEPTETGGFDEAYLDRVGAVIDALGAAGMVVLVDIHQDAYSKEIGEDGAPYWAIVPSPPRKLEGPLTDLDKRRLSKPVLDAFETFYGPSPDGARLRGRFAKMAAHVASRFAAKDAVVGLELFNEPVTNAAKNDAFHREVLAAVRAAAPDMLVFFEPPATRNILDRADIPEGPLGAGTVYAPHVYTAAFSPKDAQDAVTRDAVERSYLNAREEADAWQAPLVVGEWGFPPTSPKFADYTRWHGELAETTRASLFFWVWKEDSQGSWGLYDFPGPKERADVASALSRVRVERCAGRVRSIQRSASSLSVRFLGVSGTRENRISSGTRFTITAAQCDGAPVTVTAGEPSRVDCGGDGDHELVIAFRGR